MYCMKKYDVVIVGGGASGSLCAILLARQGLTVGVIDKNSFPAKKLLVTGNGRCNIFNANLSTCAYNQDLNNYFQKCDYQTTKDIFNNLGVETYQDEQNRCYPISNSAKSVVNSIFLNFEKYSVDYFANNIFDFFEKNNQNYVLKTDKEQIISKKIVFACGSNIQNLSIYEGVKTKKYVPSLVALKTKEKTKNFEGVRINNVLVTLTCEGKKFHEKGEILFKDNGISGICIFNLSSILARQNNFNAKISIDLLGEINEQKLFEILNNQKTIYQNSFDILTTILPEKICSEVFSRARITKKPSNELTNNEIKSLINVIKNFEFTPVSCYDNNQVFSGGIELKSLNENLENKVNKGIYYCGEICDVDAICGGYNLQWAWTSAKIVADDILKKNN